MSDEDMLDACYPNTIPDPEKVRLRAEIERLRARVKAFEASAGLLDEIARLQAFEQEAQEIRREFGWKRDGRGLVECIRERAEQAEAQLAQVVSVGHDDDCIFCGFKDRIASGEEAERLAALAAAQPEEER